jgi:alkylhydroperoxidase family enzyme
MPSRRQDADRLDHLRAGTLPLIDAILGSDGATTPEVRRAAFVGGADDARVAYYLETVQRHAYRVTDSDIDGLRAAGLDDDGIFELTAAGCS